MRKRFPQPVRVGHLIGLPVLDDDDSTIGYVQPGGARRRRQNLPDRALQRLVRLVPADWGKRPVAVPIEIVTHSVHANSIRSTCHAKISTTRPPGQPSQDKPIPPDEKTLIALGAR